MRQRCCGIGLFLQSCIEHVVVPNAERFSRHSRCYNPAVIIAKLAFALLTGIGVVWLGAVAEAAAQDEDAPSAAPSHTEFLIVLENWTDGRIYTVNRFGGNETTEMGKTLAAVGSVNPSGFTASGWGKKGAVTATAVNAIHLKVGQNPDTGFGKIFSVLPIEFVAFDATDYRSYFNQEASLFTDIKAGEGIFGGGFAPKVGDPLFISPSPDSPADRQNLARAPSVTSFPLDYGDRTFHAWTPGLPPAVGDIIVIEVRRLAPVYQWIEFENKFGGFITAKLVETGETTIIGQVYQPVFGVGRFEGSIFIGPGRIRANHPGVICISTSPVGEIGGFQIIPLEHAMSPEMKNARVLTQWMVVGPVDPRESPLWEGLTPLFSDDIYPSYISVSDSRFDDMSVFLERFLVLAMLKGDADFRPMPVHIDREDEALLDLERIRIVFPAGDYE